MCVCVWKCECVWCGVEVSVSVLVCGCVGGCVLCVSMSESMNLCLFVYQLPGTQIGLVGTQIEP